MSLACWSQYFCLLLANTSKFSSNELELLFINISLLNFLKNLNTTPSICFYRR